MSRNVPPAPNLNRDVAVPNIANLAEVVNGLNRPDRRQQLKSILGSDAAVDRFITVSLHSLGGNRDLVERCTPASIMEAIRESAVLDLEPTGILGEAWLVKHGNRAILRVGYRGYLKLIRRSGFVQAVDCQLVYDNDKFSVELGTNAHVLHVPTLDTERGGYRGSYAWARLASGELIVEWMTTADIEAVKAVSETGKRGFGPWAEWWGEMARKTVLRRLAKRLPLTAHAEAAVAVDEEGDAVEAGRDMTETRRKTLTALAESTGVKVPEDWAEPTGWREASKAMISEAEASGASLDEEDKEAVEKAMNEALGK